MTDDTKHPLVPRPAAEIAAPGRRTPRVVAVVTGDILARARAQDLGAARVPLGEYLLRAPDYRQILRWAEASGLAPEAVLERLAESSVPYPQDPRSDDAETIRFSLEDGAMVRVAWDFRRLPFIPDSWESGLLIRDLGFRGRWPDVAIALRPVLPRLQTLSCCWIELELLDLSQVPGLTELYCWFSRLTELDLTPVPGLTELHCASNKLTELDLSPVSGLTELHCGGNDLTELDLSPVPELTWLECSYSDNLTELDLSPVPRLTNLHCEGNNLTELDLTPVPGLTELDCGINALGELDLSPVPGLTKLYCWDNDDLTELDLSPVPCLTKLWSDEGLQLRNTPAGLEVNPKYDK